MPTNASIYVALDDVSEISNDQESTHYSMTFMSGIGTDVPNELFTKPLTLDRRATARQVPRLGIDLKLKKRLNFG